MSGQSVRARAFTIVEILVVIGILALLLGTLLPALSGAQKRSRKHKELNAIRQVGLAWTLYANGNNDKLLPGWLDIDVQQKWRISYEYPNHKNIDPAPTYSPGAPNLAGPWTWRLMPYLEFNHEVVHGYADEPEFDAVNLGTDMTEAAEIAGQPAFGYNANYVGGWWTTASGLPRPRYHDVTVRNSITDVVVEESANLVSRSVGTIRRSTDLITFCSSALLNTGVYRKFEFTHPGWHTVTPAWLGPDQQWNWVGALEVITPGAAAPLGRYNGLAATLYADGHTAANQIDELRDISHWIDGLPHRDYRHD